MIQKINQKYQIINSESVVALLRKMKDYDIEYKVEMEDGFFYVQCSNMDVGQLNIMSSFGKMVKKINWY